MMAFLTKPKHDGSEVKHEAPQLKVSPTKDAPRATSGSPQPPPSPCPSPSPERDLLTKLIAGSGHHHHHHHHHSHSHSHSRPSSSSRSNATHDHHRDNHLAQREAELRYKLDLLTREKTENDGFFATLRARFDREAEWDKAEAPHNGDAAAETPGEFWERFVGREETERRREELVKREGELLAELAVVERERTQMEEERALVGRLEEEEG